jgi:hypothetical protein
MKITSVRVVLLVAFLGCGCGGGSGGTGSPAAPTVHQLLSDNGRVAVGTPVAAGPWTLPGGATVTYDVVDMAAGFGSDSMDIQISSAAVVQAASGPGYGVRSGVSSSGATTTALPADSYFFVVACRNVHDDCIFGETVTATY